MLDFCVTESRTCWVLVCGNEQVLKKYWEENVNKAWTHTTTLLILSTWYLLTLDQIRQTIWILKSMKSKQLWN
jgi:hypothetical protein